MVRDGLLQPNKRFSLLQHSAMKFRRTTATNLHWIEHQSRNLLKTNTTSGIKTGASTQKCFEIKFPVLTSNQTLEQNYQCFRHARLSFKGTEMNVLNHVLHMFLCLKFKYCHFTFVFRLFTLLHYLLIWLTLLSDTNC